MRWGKASIRMKQKQIQNLIAHGTAEEFRIVKILHLQYHGRPKTPLCPQLYVKLLPVLTSTFLLILAGI